MGGSDSGGTDEGSRTPYHAQEAEHRRRCLAIVLLASVSMASAASDRPEITSMSPGSGPVGTTVTFEGRNFQGLRTVRFHGTSASFVLLSPRASAPSSRSAPTPVASRSSRRRASTTTRARSASTGVEGEAGSRHRHRHHRRRPGRLRRPHRRDRRHHPHHRHRRHLRRRRRLRHHPRHPRRRPRRDPQQRLVRL